MKDDGTYFPINPQGLMDSIDYDKVEKLRLSSSFRTIEDRDFIWAYFTKPDAAVMAVGRFSGDAFFEPEWGVHAMYIQWDRRLTERMIKNPIRYEEFRQRIQVAATPASQATAKLLDRWLDGNRPAKARDYDREVRKIRRTVETRQGQKEFRDALIEAYGARCFITGCTQLDTLEAAHIRAVKDKGRHRVQNGVLLRADVHKLFDRGLLVIDDNYVVNLHLRIKNDPCYEDLDGKDLRADAPCGQVPSLGALRFHRKSHSWD